ncbi:hypothetical protein PanWU01x14_019420, partial [Parasponia andersonii]
AENEDLRRRGKSFTTISKCSYSSCSIRQHRSYSVTTCWSRIIRIQSRQR